MSGKKKICDVCGLVEIAVLTRHHYSRQERHILKISKSKGRWTWRCANCHMAFNKLGCMRYYAVGGYWDTHFMINFSKSSLVVEKPKKRIIKRKKIIKPRLVARYTLSKKRLEVFNDSGVLKHNV